MSFEIPDELIDLYEEGIDSIMANTDFTKICRLYFAPAVNEGPNCILDTMSNVSSNRYKTGGPVPFTDGICPNCNGVGYVNQDIYTDLNMIVHWNPKSWIKVGRFVI